MTVIRLVSVTVTQDTKMAEPGMQIEEPLMSQTVASMVITVSEKKKLLGLRLTMEATLYWTESILTILTILTPKTPDQQQSETLKDRVKSSLTAGM